MYVIEKFVGPIDLEVKLCLTYPSSRLITVECALKIPSYQIALVVGDLEMVDLGGRVKVFAEKPYIESAVAEFEDLPEILAEAESYLTPYIWGNYSIIVMPPSFPWVRCRITVPCESLSQGNSLTPCFVGLSNDRVVWSTSMPINSLTP
jgi:hypothetical protein